MKTDVVLGLIFGDEGKAKITAELAKSSTYSHSIRFNGSHNAGHTFYINGEKVVTHMIPTAAVFGVRSVIGHGCVVHEDSFLSELEYLKQYQPRIADLVRIAEGTHIVQDSHRNEESLESKLGTTRMGVGPCYRDKYARTGVRAGGSSRLKDFVVNIYDWLDQASGGSLLAEGAQAMGLDIDSENYPYVTSSHCGVGGLINNGVPLRSIRNVFGICKAYDTYVGSRTFQDPTDEDLKRIAAEGSEFGATTGRARQVNYIDLNTLGRMAKRADATHLFVNKVDILKKLDVFRALVGGKVHQYASEDEFCQALAAAVPSVPPQNITFSYYMDKI